MPYTVEFAESVEDHFRALTAGIARPSWQQSTGSCFMNRSGETRNRKPLRPNPVAPWELRVGHLRVFYEVVGADGGVVRILAVGRKQRNVLTIGGEEIQL